MSRWKQRVLLFAIAVLLIAPLGHVPIGHAQTAAVRLQVPILSFPGGERSTIRITVSELGQPGASSRVRIRLLDETEHLLTGGLAEGDLRHGLQARLDYRLTAFGGRVMQAGATIDIDRGIGAMPVVVVEHVQFDPIDSKIATRIVCGPPGKVGDPVMPSPPDDGIQHVLTGCAATSLTTGF